MTATYVCPVCASSAISVFLQIPRAPVFCNQLCHSRAAAIAAPVAEIRLGFCTDCGHVHNVAFDPALLDYSPEYENCLHCSPRFQDYASDLAEQLRTRYSLQGKTIVEIGCGRGDFLKALCRAGSNRGFGFDPGYPEEPGKADPETGVVIFRQAYSDAPAMPAPDLVSCRQCLEHIASPKDFLRQLRATSCRREGTAVFFEVPNALFIFRHGSIWDIIYEHCGYFCPSSLSRVFEAADFSVVEVAETFEGQFLTLHAVTGGVTDPRHSPWRSLTGLQNDIQRFSELFHRKTEDWRARLQTLSQCGQRVVVWGAGSKGNMFLNLLHPQEVIEYIVDINPRKQGKFVVGTGQEIVAPEFLRRYRPDVIVVMNPVYTREIDHLTQALGLDVEFLSA